MKILFVCTGNTCRSPMAEGLARRVATERGIVDVEIASAGTSAWEGAPASDGSLLVCLERGVDLSTHRARLLTKQMVAQTDLVLAMGPHHLERIEALGGGDHSYLLTSFASNGADERAIADPVGAELDVYRATAVELEDEIRAMFNRLEAGRAPDSP